jgi:hypothetical protein
MSTPTERRPDPAAAMPHWSRALRAARRAVVAHLATDNGWLWAYTGYPYPYPYPPPGRYSGRADDQQP